MRAKYIWRVVPYEESITHLYARITLTKHTTAYFFVALAHCLLQIVLLSVSVSESRGLSKVLADTTEAAGVPHRFATVQDGSLFVCEALPPVGTMNTCFAIAGTGASEDSTLPEFMTNGVADVVLNATLSPRCVESLAWPKHLFDDAAREDVTLLFAQIWLFVVSVVAIVNESIPHLIASLAGNVITTAWSVSQFPRWSLFMRKFTTLVVADACEGANVLPAFWGKRVAILAPSLVFGILFLIATAALTWKLFKIYAQQVFMHVGASEAMNRLYKIVMVFMVFLQLSAFFLLAASALWVEELLDGFIAEYARHRTVYLTVFSISCILVPIWFVIGLRSIRAERRLWAAAFTGMGVLLTVAWLAMHASEVYRWTFANWTFFAALTMTSFVLLVATLALGVVCWRNFGKGLAPYLKMQETFDTAEFETVYPETVKRGRDEYDASEKAMTPSSGGRVSRAGSTESKSRSQSVSRSSIDKSSSSEFMGKGVTRPSVAVVSTRNSQHLSDSSLFVPLASPPAYPLVFMWDDIANGAYRPQSSRASGRASQASAVPALGPGPQLVGSAHGSPSPARPPRAAMAGSTSVVRPNTSPATPAAPRRGGHYTTSDSAPFWRPDDTRASVRVPAAVKAPASTPAEPKKPSSAGLRLSVVSLDALWDALDSPEERRRSPEGTKAPPNAVLSRSASNVRQTGLGGLRARELAQSRVGLPLNPKVTLQPGKTSTYI